MNCGKTVLRRKSLLQPSIYKGCRREDLRNEIPGRGRERTQTFHGVSEFSYLRNEIPGRGRELSSPKEAIPTWNLRNEIPGRGRELLLVPDAGERSIAFKK